MADAALDALVEAWRARWPEALALWSRYTQLGEPRWCRSGAEAAHEGLTESFAMIRLRDQAIVLNMHQIRQASLERFPLEIMGHEIGHHMYTPASVNEAARLLARMRRALPSRETHAPMLANMFEDLLINDRLQRARTLDLAGVYAQLEKTASREQTAKPSPLWTLYMRIFEILWSLPRQSLARALSSRDAVLEGDAQLGARIVRVYARDWQLGGGRFASLCFPYLEEESTGHVMRVLRGWLDALTPNAGGEAPTGLVEIDDDEMGAGLHPSADPALTGEDGEAEDDEDEPGKRQGRRLSEKTPGPPVPKPSSPGGQARLPFEYGSILRALGMPLDDHEAAVLYYRDRARPHLVRFPTVRQPESDEPEMEGLEAWDIGSPLEEVDWLQSVMASPRVIPGFTTYRRAWGRMAGVEPKRQPIDLDLYVDCSGSMPNPQQQISYLTLAGAIMCLSALRAGARVQVTLWSGPGQFEMTQGFITDETALLRVLTGYICGGTAFPLHVLVDTYADRASRLRHRKTHIMVISDEGVDTMLAKDNRGTDGADIARMALDRAGGGGTLLLNLYLDWHKSPPLVRLHELGFDVTRVSTWEDLVGFAREFSRKKYGSEETHP